MKKAILIILGVALLWWISSKVQEVFEQSFITHWITKDGFFIGSIRVVLIIVAAILLIRKIKKDY